MQVSRIKYFPVLFFIVLVTGEIRAMGFDNGIWLGYTHGAITPVVPKAKMHFHKGYWTGIQAGYDYTLSNNSLVSFGLERSSVYRYSHDGMTLANSFVTGASFSYHYYPLNILPQTPDRHWVQSIRPYAAFGLSVLYWSNQAVKEAAAWKGLYLLPTVSVGAGVPLGDYTFLHAGIASRASVAGPAYEMDGLSYQIRVAYDFHVREQQVLMQSHVQMQALADDLRERSDSMSRELQEEMDKVKYAVTEYEALLKRMMSTIDSIEAVNRKLRTVHADSIKELRQLRTEFNETHREFNAIRWNAWDTVSVIATTDTTEALKDPLNRTTGAYLVLYTGEANRVTRRLYEEMAAEYERTWLIENDFGVQRVMIWVPEENLEKEWQNLSPVFTDISRFTPKVR